MKSVASRLLLPCGLALCLDVATAQQNTWTALPPMTARALLAGAAVGGRVYAVGGGNWTCGVTSALEGYDPMSNAWTALPGMPTPRYEFGAAELNGLLYAAGGNPGCGSASSALRAVEAYDPVAKSWSSKAPLPTGLWDGAVASANGQLFVIGGFTTAVYAYDPAQNSWSTKAPLPQPYAAGAVAVVDGTIYVIGGSQGSQNAVMAYHPVTDTWTIQAPMPTPRTYGAGAAVNGVIYVAGGYTGTGIVATVEAYHVASDTWSTVTPLPYPVWSACAVALNGTLYIMGGFDANHATLGNVESLTPPGAELMGIATYAGLTLAGTVGSTNRIDYKDDLAVTNWTVLTNLVLPSSPYLFIDPTPASGSHRFYRVTAP